MIYHILSNLRCAVGDCVVGLGAVRDWQTFLEGKCETNVDSLAHTLGRRIKISNIKYIDLSELCDYASSPC